MESTVLVGKKMEGRKKFYPSLGDKKNLFFFLTTSCPYRDEQGIKQELGEEAVLVLFFLLFVGPAAEDIHLPSPTKQMKKIRQTLLPNQQRTLNKTAD